MVVVRLVDLDKHLVLNRNKPCVERATIVNISCAVLNRSNLVIVNINLAEGGRSRRNGYGQRMGAGIQGRGYNCAET